MHCGMAKSISQVEAMSNSEKIEPVALAVISYTCLKVSLATQSIKNKNKTHSNFLKAFWVDLKAFLGLDLPNQIMPSS